MWREAWVYGVVEVEVELLAECGENDEVGEFVDVWC
jgi:hypothetical protein